jgi:hypothetical protein
MFRCNMFIQPSTENSLLHLQGDKVVVSVDDIELFLTHSHADSKNDSGLNQQEEREMERFFQTKWADIKKQCEAMRRTLVLSCLQVHRSTFLHCDWSEHFASLCVHTMLHVLSSGK